jgi:RNA polymerase sigma-70 factor (ECF subfamily)
MAEDLQQETFLKAILSMDGKHTNMRAWLYMVARNLCFNQMKREKRLRPLEEISENASTEETKDILDRFLLSERIQALYGALSELSGLKREILMLQYFGRLSQRDIAAILDLSLENVRVLAFRAKKELRLYMEAKGYDIP